MYYRITTYYDTIGTKKIPSKCPKCGNRDSLELEFFQIRNHSGFLETVTKKVTGILHCNHCKIEIPPVLWTDEIENYFNVEKKKQTLNPTKVRFKLENKKFFYSMMAIIFVVFAGAIGYAKYNMHKTEVLEERVKNVTIGDKVEVMYSLMENHAITKSGTTWFIVKKVDAYTVWLQRNKDFVQDTGHSFDLENQDFNAETIEVSLEQYKRRGLFGLDYTQQKFAGFITNIE